MKLLLLALTLALTPGLHAAWTFEERSSLPSPTGLVFTRVKATSESGRSADVHSVSFRSATHTCVVADNPDGSLDLAAAAAARGALAGVNGGYFHPDRAPLGLVISEGRTLHAQERARLLSGLYLSTGAGMSLLRVGEYRPSAKTTPREALQAGPFLVDAGKAVPGLNASRAAARTAIATDGAGNWALLTVRSATLAETGELLATAGLLPWKKMSRALNFDGGSSTSLWVASSPLFYERGLRDVRNYILIVPRKK